MAQIEKGAGACEPDNETHLGLDAGIPPCQDNAYQQ